MFGYKFLTELKGDDISVDSDDDFNRLNDHLQTVDFQVGNPAVQKYIGKIIFYKLNDDAHPIQISNMVMLNDLPTLFPIDDLCRTLVKYSIQIQTVRIFCPREPNQGSYFALLTFLNEEIAVTAHNILNNQEYVTLVGPNFFHCVFVKKIVFCSDISPEYIPLAEGQMLPTCSFCLNKLDYQVTGIIILPCLHSSHCDCYVKWNNECPVCRYTFDPEPIICDECQINNDLYMCIICGHVGCGRYDSKHALLHFNQTNHIFAVHIRSNRIWDYAGDCYVHRLIECDGKMVEVANPNGCDEDDPKLKETLRVEFETMILVLLESQQQYLESKYNEKETEYKEQLHQLKLKIDHFKKKKKPSHSDDVEFLTAINNSLVEDKLHYEKNLRDIENKYKEEIIQKDKKIQELEEQLNDVMRHLEYSESLSKNGVNSGSGGTIQFISEPIGSKGKRKSGKK